MDVCTELGSEIAFHRCRECQGSKTVFNSAAGQPTMCNGEGQRLFMTVHLASRGQKLV